MQVVSYVTSNCIHTYIKPQIYIILQHAPTEAKMGHGTLNHVAWAEALFLIDSIPSEICACRLDTVAAHYTVPDAHGHQDPEVHGHQDPDAVSTEFVPFLPARNY